VGDDGHFFDILGSNQRGHHGAHAAGLYGLSGYQRTRQQVTLRLAERLWRKRSISTPEAP